MWTSRRYVGVHRVLAFGALAWIASCSKTNTVSSDFAKAPAAATSSKTNPINTPLQFLGLSTLTFQNGTFSLAWPKAVSQLSPIITYTVYKDSYTTTVMTTSDLTAQVSGSGYTAGQTATFSVRSSDGLANVDTATVTKALTLTAVINCSTTLNATAASDTAVTLSLNTCKDATVYNIYQVDASGANPVLFDTVAPSTTSSTTYYVATGLTLGRSYNFYVTPFDGTGIGGMNSNTATVKTLTAQKPVFTGVISATTQSGTNGMTQIDLTWNAGQSNASTQALKYHVYYSTSASSVFTSTPTATNNSQSNAAEGNFIVSSNTTTTVAGLAPKTTYYFGVRAYELDSSQNIVQEQNVVLAQATTNAPDESSLPSIASISPLFGAPAGGTTITITGANFNPGSHISLGGVTASSTWISATSMTAVTPAHAAGVVDVVYTSSTGKLATLPSGFSYTMGLAPVVSSLSTSAVPTTGGTSVTISGSNFVAGASVILAGSTITPSAVTASTITFTTLGASAGTYDVLVKNPDLQTGTLSAGLTFLGVPTLTTLSPTVVSANGGATLTVNGTGFTNPMTVSIGGSNCINVSVLSSTQLTCTTPARAAATVSVVVTNQAGLAATLASSLIVTSNAAPVITSLSPTAGATGGGNTLTITGTGFVAGATVTIGSSACTSVTVVSSTSITCTLPSSTANTKQVMVTLLDTQQSNTQNYTYTSNPGPFVSNISPTIGYWPLGSSGTAPSITITGSSFSTSGGSVTIGSTACTITSATTTSIACSLGTQAAGTYDLVVLNSDGQGYTASNGFTYAVNPAPTVTSVSPASGAMAGGTGVTITGTGLTTGATVKINGAACTGPNVVSGTTMTCTTPSSAISGLVSVAVTNADGQTGTKSNGYLYLGPVTVSSVLPSAGALGGGANLTITGTGFASPAIVTINSASCTSTTVVSSTQITCTGTPANSAGPYGVKVTNPDGQNNTLASSYTYQAGPNISSISPTSGSPSGGTSVTINGTNFNTGVALTIGGQSCTSLTYNSSTSLTCVVRARTGPTVSAVDLVVTNTDSQTYTMTSGYTYNQYSRVDLVAGVYEPYGYMDSNTGSNVRFKGITQMVSDGTYLYGIDKSNVIRKINMTTGATTTLAGNSSVNACNDGVGNAASYKNLASIAIDSTNSYLFIADKTCNTMSKVTIATGNSQTLFSGACNNQMVLDPTNSYIFCSFPGSALKVGKYVISTGALSVFSGIGVSGGADGAAGAATFSGIGGMTRDANYLYVTDSYAVRKVSLADGTVTTIAGVYNVGGATDGTGSSASFGSMSAITTDGTNLYVNDNSYNNIRKIVIATGVVTTPIASSGAYAAVIYGQIDGQVPATGKIYGSSSVALYTDGNFIYTSGTDLLVRKFQLSNSMLTTIAGGGNYMVSQDGTGTNARFTANRDLYMSDQKSISLVSDGTSLFGLNKGFFQLDTSTYTKSTLFSPQLLATSNGETYSGATIVGGFAYIGSGSSNIIRCSMSTYSCASWIGLYASYGYVDGAQASARFQTPTSLGNDGTNIYVYDGSNCSIRTIVIASANVSTLAGNQSSCGYADGTGTAARFGTSQSVNVMVYDSGNLYVADAINHVIRKIVVATGVVTTLAGAGGTSGYVNSSNSGVVRFNNPNGITTDGLGNLYVSDAGNYAVRKVVIATGATTTIAGRGTYPYDYEVDGVISSANFGVMKNIFYFGGNLYVASFTGIRIIH